MELSISLTIPDFEKEVQNIVDNALDEIVLRLRAKLVEKLTQYGLGGSSLIGRIDVHRISNGIVMSVGGEHATFVEYGTGIKGSRNPHPNPTGWSYDTNNHGESGWWYPTDMSDPNPTKRIGSNGEVYAWTKGMASRPFMYETWLYCRRIATKTINKHLRKAGL